METNIHFLPDDKQQDIQQLCHVVLDEVEQITGFAKEKRKHGRVLKIILFGSYARNTWVHEPLPNGYQSDYDILVVVNQQGLEDNTQLWYQVEERISRTVKVPVNILIHTLEHVNYQLAEGNYFFKDIYNEGIEVYCNGKSQLKAPGKLSEAEARVIAQKHFDKWFKSAKSFLIAYDAVLEAGELNNAAFQLHQATERFYTCLLLVHTNYKPKSHNLKHLNGLAIEIHASIADVFPADTKQNRRHFELLKNAYIEARYSEHYQITQDELAWLHERVQMLKERVEVLCLERLNK